MRYSIRPLIIMIAALITAAFLNIMFWDRYINLWSSDSLEETRLATTIGLMANYALLSLATYSFFAWKFGGYLKLAGILNRNNGDTKGIILLYTIAPGLFMGGIAVIATLVIFMISMNWYEPNIGKLATWVFAICGLIAIALEAVMVLFLLRSLKYPSKKEVFKNIDHLNSPEAPHGKRAISNEEAALGVASAFRSSMEGDTRPKSPGHTAGTEESPKHPESIVVQAHCINPTREDLIKEREKLEEELTGVTEPNKMSEIKARRCEIQDTLDKM